MLFRKFLLVFCIFCQTCKASSYVQQRYTNVVGQSSWFTCGPASLATLVKYYYGVETTELEMLELSAPELTPRYYDTEGNTYSALNALQLKTGLQKKGFVTKGYRFSLTNLQDYFAQGGLPIILHVTKPQLHFLLAVGIVGGDHILLADPSWGRRILPLSELESDKGFSGVVLVTFPNEEQAATASKNQEENLNWAIDRLKRLRGY